MFINLGNPVSSSPLNNGLVGWWLGLRNNSGTSTLFDLSGRNQGTLTNGPTWTAGVPAFSAVNFAGTNQYVSVTNGGGLNNLQSGSIVIACRWTATQPANYGVYGAVLSRQENGVLSNQIVGLGGTNPATAGVNFGMDVYSPVITGSTAVGLNVDRHIVITYRSGSQSLYLDGVLDGTGGGTGGIANSASTPMTIGAWPGDGSVYSISVIHSVQVYSRELSGNEAWRLYNQWQRGYPDTLRRWSRRSSAYVATSPPPASTGKNLLLLGVG